MTLDEAREVLAGAAWTRETPLVALLDEIVGRYNMTTSDSVGNKQPGAITREFAGYRRSQVSSGRVVQLLISLRRQNGMPLYTLQA